MDDGRLNPTDYRECFVCGDDNPSGLHLEIRRDGDAAVARFVPGRDHQGWPDVLHGGLVGLLVDEMLVYAGAVQGIEAVTASVSYRLRRPIPIGAELALLGRVTRASGRGYRAAVELRLEDGTLAAEGEGTCIPRRD